MLLIIKFRKYNVRNSSENNLYNSKITGIQNESIFVNHNQNKFSMFIYVNSSCIK